MQAATARAELEVVKSRDADTVLLQLDEGLVYKNSQIEFYDDGIQALERLYKISVEDLRKKETQLAEIRLDNMRKAAKGDATQARKKETLEEYNKAKAELAGVMEQWNNLDGELQLMYEKQRSASNSHIASITNDSEALREWRKFKYFTEMVVKLKIQLKSENLTITDHRPERLYAAVLRHKIPLGQWVGFTKSQLLRLTQDEGTPLELDDETGKVHQMLQYLSDRVKRIEGNTWPDA